MCTAEGRFDDATGESAALIAAQGDVGTFGLGSERPLEGDALECYPASIGEREATKAEHRLEGWRAAITTGSSRVPTMPDNVDYRDDGYKELAHQVAETIRQVLSQRALPVRTGTP